MAKRFVPVLFAAVALLVAGESNAAEATRAAVEVATPPAVYGTDAASLQAIAAGELREFDARRAGVVSVGLAEPTGDPIVVGVDATVRESKTGKVLAVIETETRATGPMSPAQTRAMAHTAVQLAVRRVPSALTPAK